MSSYIEKIGEEASILDYRWVIQLRQICIRDRDYPLDWYRMTAIAILLSEGEVSRRTIDWNYLEDKLLPNNPILIPHYDEDERPKIEIIDRATRWGLFQILGDEARALGYTGSFLGLASIDANIKLACQKLLKEITKIEDQINKIETEGGDFALAEKLTNSLPDIAEERVFGVNPNLVNLLAQKFQRTLKEEIEAFKEL